MSKHGDKPPKPDKHHPAPAPPPAPVPAPVPPPPSPPLNRQTGQGSDGMGTIIIQRPVIFVPPANFDLGVNISGLDFSGSNILSPTTADLDYFYGLGCRRFRLPCRWEKIQPTLNGALDTTVLADLKALIDGAQSRGMRCLLDIHNFGGYTVGGVTTYPFGDPNLPSSAFADLWSRLASYFAYVNSGTLSYDLMNEPTGVIGGESTWITYAKAAISAIRGTGEVNKWIYVEGYAFASTWNWTAANPTLHTVRDVDSTGRIKISGHCYFDHNNEGAYFDWDTEVATPGGAPSGINTNVNIGVQRTTQFLSWLQVHGFPGHIGEVGIPASWSNPRPSNDTNWGVTFLNFITAMQAASVEVDAWSAGPYWGNYPQSQSPYGGRQSRIITVMQTVWGTTAINPTVYFAEGPTRGTAGVASSNFTVDYRGHLGSSVTITPHSSAGGTWTPTTAVLSGDNPTATFTLNIATQQISSITFTNSAALTNPPASIYTTQVDDFTTMAANLQNVFSFERKVSTYLGPCLRLRRAVDNVESDFNFTANTMYAYLDTAAIATWAGASAMYLVKGYNQASLTNPNDMVIPYSDTTGTTADQPQFVLDYGDGYPALIFNGSRMQWESPLEQATGQVIITNANLSSANGYALIDWSFVGFADTFNPGWGFVPDDGTHNIYGTTSDRLNMAGFQEVDEWHVLSGSWTGGPLVSGCKLWRNNVLMSVGDSGAPNLSVDFHRNGMGVGWHRFANGTWQGRLREIIIINTTVADNLVATIAGRSITKYNTAASHTAVAPDIVLDFAANTYTVDGSGSTLGANIASSPSRDANGLIMSGSQTYTAAGPLLAALQGGAYTIQTDTFGVPETVAAGGRAIYYFTDGTTFEQYGWDGNAIPCHWLGLGGTVGGQVPANSGGHIYSDNFTAGFRMLERHHITAKTATAVDLTTEGEIMGTGATTLPNWTSANIGWWPGLASLNMVGRIMRIKVWRTRLTRTQQLLATQNLGAKGSVPAAGFRMGTNLAGMEFGNGLPGGFEAVPTPAETTYYNQIGFKILRIPFKWERMQPTLNGALATGELNNLKSVVASNKAVGITTLLDLHNYASYFDVATNASHSIGDGFLTTAHGSDFWSRMSQVPEFNDALVWFGLMNEPGGALTQAQWFTNCAAWTAAIRANNTVSYVTVPGYSQATSAAAWSGLYGQAFLDNYSDSANLSAFEVHQYFDHDNSGSHDEGIQGTARRAFSNVIRFARVNNKKFIIGECGWSGDNFNVQSHLEALDAMTLLRNADDVCIGFCNWSGGPAWGGYFQSIEPYRAGVLNDGFNPPRGDRAQVALMRNWIPNPY